MSQKLVYKELNGEATDLLNKYFVSCFRSGYVVCNDVVLPKYFQLFGDKIQKMNIRSDDIWVCSFPKTGKLKFYIH